MCWTHNVCILFFSFSSLFVFRSRFYTICRSYTRVPSTSHSSLFFLTLFPLQQFSFTAFTIVYSSFYSFTSRGSSWYGIAGFCQSVRLADVRRRMCIVTPVATPKDTLWIRFCDREFNVYLNRWKCWRCIRIFNRFSILLLKIVRYLSIAHIFILFLFAELLKRRKNIDLNIVEPKTLRKKFFSDVNRASTETKYFY